MRPPFKPFSYFAKVNEDQEIIEFPIEPMTVVNEHPGVDYTALIDQPPQGYVSVFMDSNPPSHEELQKVVEKTPIKKEDGFFYQNWEVVDMSFEEIDQVLANVRSEINNSINEARLKANQYYFPFEGKKIACDLLSRSDIDGLNGWISINNKMPDNWLGAWKAKDNSFVSIPDLETWKRFYNAMFMQGQINFQHSQTLKEKIYKASTLEAIRAINWDNPTGLPYTPLPQEH